MVVAVVSGYSKNNVGLLRSITKLPFCKTTAGWNDPGPKVKVTDKLTDNKDVDVIIMKPEGLQLKPKKSFFLNRLFKSTVKLLINAGPLIDAQTVRTHRLTGEAHPYTYNKRIRR